MQGEWVLIVDEGLKMAGNSRRRSNAPRSRQVVIPIHSLGVSLLSRLPGCCARCCGAGALAASRSVLVRIHPADVPKSIRFAITPERLRSGGALRSTISPRASPREVCLKSVAWLFNLSVLLYGLTFLLFAYLVIIEEAQIIWRLGVLKTFSLACLLGFLLSDLAVATLVACLPMKAKKTNEPLSLICGYIASLLELEEVMVA